MPIILTEAEAARVRGVSPTKEGHAIDPVPIKGDLFMLGNQVLDDPVHADVRAVLAALPRRKVDVQELYGEGEELSFEARSGQYRESLLKRRGAAAQGRSVTPTA